MKIKATIQNSPYCTEITFPCSETELAKKLGEIKMNPEHLAPMATVIGIEPAELYVLEDCDVSLDALNFLGKRLDGLTKLERKQFLAALDCKEANIGCGLKNIINLTYNLPRYTLIESTDNPEKIGLKHMLNIRGVLSESEYQNREWLVEEGRKLLDSGKGINTEYGKLYINEEIPFEEIFNGRTFPVYYCSSNMVAAVEIGYDGYKESVELPCEEIAIKKAISRLGADSVTDCEIEVDSTLDMSDELWEKIQTVEETKDIFGLNQFLKSEQIRMDKAFAGNIFNAEIARQLSENNYSFSEKNGEITVELSDNSSVKIHGSDVLYSDCKFSEKSRAEYLKLARLVRGIYEYCADYENAPPMPNLSGGYREVLSHNGAVLAMSYNEKFGFGFATFLRDENGVCNGNYFADYDGAKSNFAIRSGLIDGDKYFENSELERLRNCVKFAMENDGNLHFDEYDALKKLDEKISENIPEQQQNSSPKLSM